MNIWRESTIDFYVVCERVLPYVKSMKIDNGKGHTLTNYQRGAVGVNSDHKPLLMDIELEVQPQIKQKVEILNFKDTTSQKRFSDITSKTSVFTECVESVENVSHSCLLSKLDKVV